MNKENQNSDEYGSLKYLNAAMSLFQTIQGFFILYLSNGFTFPVTTTYLSRNSFLNIVTPKTIEIFRFPLANVLAAVLFMSAISHLLLILPGIHTWYIKNLKKNINYMRWIEYSISASTMIVLISLLSGIFDLSALILLFFMDFGMILFGLLAERINLKDKKASWTAFYFGCLIGVVPWVIISMYIAGAWQNQPSIIPGFVYRVLITIFIFFNSFAVNALLWMLKIGPWKNYLFVEKAYLFLSLASKSALAWEIFTGVLM